MSEHPVSGTLVAFLTLTALIVGAVIGLCDAMPNEDAKATVQTCRKAGMYFTAKLTPLGDIAYIVCLDPDKKELP